MKTLLFDLDGTLLPMDVDAFTRKYLGLLAHTVKDKGFEDSQKLIQTIWQAVGCMVMQGGATTNEEAFWKHFDKVYGEQVRETIPYFEDFYNHQFCMARDTCGFNEKAAETIRLAKEKGWRVILATNPIFPAVATNQRVCWAGLKPEDFEYISTYENSRFCKPDPRYYSELIEKCDLDPAECVMIGNDTGEDSPAQQTGMDFFLLTDCLINEKEKDISAWPNGSFDDLQAYLNLK